MKKNVSTFLGWAVAAVSCVWASNAMAVDGQQLYERNCSACHGPGGQCGEEENVQGESARKIREAIDEEREMDRLRGLSDADIQAIADFLATVRDGGGGDDDSHDDDSHDDVNTTVFNDPNSSIMVNLIALHDTSAPSPPFDSNCVGCHGNKSSGRALDGRKDAHAEMVQKSPGCTTNEKCLWCHEYIEVEPWIQSGYQSTLPTASLRKPYDAVKCVWCHGVGTEEQFYAD